MDCIKTIENFLIGKIAKADHPIITGNPSETFEITDVVVTHRPDKNGHVVSVRGKDTMWFGYNTWNLV